MLASIEPVSRAPDVLQVILLAVVQGLTEFLPVSSDGHLVLTESALGLTETGLLLPVALHVGTWIAVVVVYRGTLRHLLAEVAAGRPRYVLLVLLGSLPAGLVGVLFEDWFEQRFSEPRSAAWGLIGTAAILLGSELARRRRRPPLRTAEGLRATDALVIGAAQAVSILPGVSRSGSTIGAGMALGLQPSEAASYSFLLSLIAVGGAAALQVPKLLSGEDPGNPGVALLCVGILISGLVGWACLRLLLAFLSRGAFLWFAAYCALLGSGCLLFS